MFGPLDELYKKHPVCTKIRLFEIQYQKIPQIPPHAYPSRLLDPRVYAAR